ncbi:uncharacterized protein LAESUDRAFT_720104 [Laetiporus sulphureus 93-53]|uniref:Uncharacterized protein n=1 Tax=Laetiporus sulphureus 93-53 TaxID=1314785 RepID=A0A165HSU1_9APHY|nr:uncharacterized protein LAESUDRAFT_720104 [Laetiporus sulphureus 93-53]KZT12138.1 hypothetical protein LAESUDRAFT_720104 [Laetiporus sulphureus 93-53]
MATASARILISVSMGLSGMPTYAGTVSSLLDLMEVRKASSSQARPKCDCDGRRVRRVLHESSRAHPIPLTLSS